MSLPPVPLVTPFATIYTDPLLTPRERAALVRTIDNAPDHYWDTTNDAEPWDPGVQYGVTDLPAALASRVRALGLTFPANGGTALLYQKGDRITSHVDKMRGQLRLSILLVAPEAGGVLEMGTHRTPACVPIASPPLGGAVLFSSNHYHAVTEVRKGRRLVLVLDVRRRRPA
mgnify:FL=1